MAKHVIPPFAPLGAEPPRRAPRRGVRAAVAGGVVVAMLAAATPARAFLSFLDPMAYAVVAEMVVLITQMVSVKRQIENYRNQASTYVHGKLAPLREGLAPMRDAMEKTDRSVQGYLSVVDGALLPTAEWNLPVEDCTSGVTGGTPGFAGALPPCLPTAAGYGRPAALGGLALSPEHLASLFPAGAPGSPALLAERQAREREGVALYAEQRRRVVSAQADHEIAMALVEEWRGCREYAGGLAGGDRLPCYTDPRDGAGTDGMQQEILTTLEGVDMTQGGDVTIPQLQALRTQAAVAQARMEAQLAEMQVREAEEENRTRVLATQAWSMQRAQRLRTLACQYENGTVFPDGTYSRNLSYVATAVRPLPDGSYTRGVCTLVGAAPGPDTRQGVDLTPSSP